MSQASRKLTVAVVGDVDHGKSTLVARLLHGAGALPEARVAEMIQAARARGVEFEWSFALDSLQAERDQAVTIGAARARASFGGVEFLFRDAPGHSRFAGAAATAASSASAGLLVVDAVLGITKDTLRHARAAAFLGVTRWVVAINKMDLAGRRQSTFDAVAAVVDTALRDAGASIHAAVPVVAKDAENFFTTGAAIDWYAGPTLAAALVAVAGDTADDAARALRLPIQDVLRSNETRVLVGRVESGSLRVGAELLFSPSGERARVAAFETGGIGQTPSSVETGGNVAFSLDRAVYVARGEMASAPSDAPALIDGAQADILWLADPAGAALRARLGTAECSARISNGGFSASGEVVSGRIEFDALMCADQNSRGVLVAGGRIVAGFRVRDFVDRRWRAREGLDLGIANSSVTREERAARAGHRGGVLWLTGLPGAGKSTLANAVERRLFDLGWRVYVLDGDNLRHGLNADLGFSPGDRAENIRRAGEVAALFAASGTLCIAAFVSPYRADRATARAAAQGTFREVFVNATPEACATRDPKGLYAKARAGMLTGLTGYDAPYEAPENPDLTVDTVAASIDDCVGEILAYARREYS